jgi:NAD(P)-dependent dehydrogenase (short-subunit alcohol dehydrogenase family)
MALSSASAKIMKQARLPVISHVIDTSDTNSVHHGIQSVAAQLGGLDILVNCAAEPGALGPAPSLTEISDDMVQREINVKVLGYLRCAREAAPYMIKGGWGRIINISGLAARQTGSLIGSVRNISVAALSKNLADELGPAGINVTCVHPGLTRTEKTSGNIHMLAKEAGLSPEEMEHKMAQRNSIRRIISAEEVADFVVFLASPKSIGINGESIAVGGGAPGSIYY